MEKKFALPTRCFLWIENLIKNSFCLAATCFSFWFWKSGGTVKKHPVCCDQTISNFPQTVKMTNCQLSVNYHKAFLNISNTINNFWVAIFVSQSLINQVSISQRVSEGRVRLQNQMNFWKSANGGRGDHFQSKKLQILGTLNRNFWAWNW